MKPRELFREVAAFIPVSNGAEIVSSPERKRLEEADKKFSERATELIDHVESIDESPEGPNIMRSLGLEFLSETRIIVDGDLEVEIKTRGVILTSVPAGEDIDSLVGANQTAYKRIAVGVNDLRFQQKGKSWTSRNGARSCDILTELYLNYDENGDDVYNPLEDFIVLERSNWQHPVFEAGKPTITGSYFSAEVEAQARQRLNSKGWEPLLGGMHASLDDLETALEDRARQ